VLREIVLVSIRGPAFIITGNGAAMKNYSEQRGGQSQIIFDAVSGQFVQRQLSHEFEVATKANITRRPDALVIAIPKSVAKSGASSLLRKSRQAVMQTVDMKRVG
jgi:hypothetical protein